MLGAQCEHSPVAVGEPTLFGDRRADRFRRRHLTHVRRDARPHPHSVAFWTCHLPSL
jgi:hypothetical protein